MREFLMFLEAREKVRRIGLRSKKEWYQFIKGKLCNLPSNPSKMYKGQWKGWMDWMGYDKKIMPPTYNRTHKVNESFFEKWSADMAYVLGYWFADGCITKGDCISISTAASDKYILKKIAKVMGSDHRISPYRSLATKKVQYSLNIYSKKIFSDIQKLGGKERKSLDMDLPHVPSKYFADFLRGYFDGDGCIHYNKNDKCYITTFVSGSKVFAEKLLAQIKNRYNTGGSIFEFKNKKSGNFYYRTYFNKNDTIRLKQAMYYPDLLKGSKLMLKRKYSLFLKTGDITRILRNV